jgi:ABC-type antimicrobial peptide transport system permease subunit
MEFPKLRSLLYAIYSLYLLGNFSVGISQQASKLKSFNLTSFGISVGSSLENFDFGIQYNEPIKEINQVYAPSILELLVTFDFCIYIRNNRDT